jgi:hypothetical protein
LLHDDRIVTDTVCGPAGADAAFGAEDEDEAIDDDGAGSGSAAPLDDAYELEFELGVVFDCEPAGGIRQAPRESESSAALSIMRVRTGAVRRSRIAS